MELEELSVVEKAAMLSGGSEWDSRGNDRADIPSFVMSDGPHGVRRQLGEGDHLGIGASKPATCFPTAGTVANSWDPALAEEMGEALGSEAHDLDVNVLLGPGLNIKRNPLCGRNFEYYSEDPIVAGRMAAGLIRGIQSNGISACPKHFAVNSQELRRQASNSVVDERTMRELYLTGFEIAVREAKPLTIMTSYNEINGVYAHENKHLLQEILRDEWGYEGLVVSDWIGKRNTVAQVHAGNDLMMPGEPAQAREIVEAVRSGRLAEADVDRCVTRVLEYILRTPVSGNKPCRRLPTWKHMLPYRVRWQRKAWFCSATKALLYHLPQDVISRCSESMPMTALPEVRAPDTSTKPIRSIWTKVCATPDSGLTPVRQISMQNTCLSVRHCSRSRTPCVIWAKVVCPRNDADAGIHRFACGGQRCGHRCLRPQFG